MIETKITGIKDFKEALESIPGKLRRRALLNALRKGARLVRDTARAATPVLSLAGLIKAPNRKRGTVKKAIAVRTSRVARAAGNVGVFVNVRPAGKLRVVTAKKTGTRRVSGRGADDDPFYWRFLEFGTKKMRAFHFLTKGAQRLDDARQVIENELGAQLEKLNRNPKDPL
jgi:HK97 gp10 family phage protein